MKINIALLLILFLCFSCVDNHLDKKVDKSTLTGGDYRLFQDTKAWNLAKAVYKEQTKSIYKIVNSQPDLIDYQEPKYGNTLLAMTVINQQMQSFKTLLANKANVNIHDTFSGASALIDACSSPNYNIKFAELLIKNGANVNDIEVGKRKQGNSTRFTPLMAASSRSGNIALVKLLIINGADVNYQNEFKQTALSEAVLQDRYPIILYLLEQGADFRKPIFYREQEYREIYLIDILRETYIEFNTSAYIDKQKIISLLRRKGLDYKSVPIPDFIKEEIIRKHTKDWRYYLENY